MNPTRKDVRRVRKLIMYVDLPEDGRPKPTQMPEVSLANAATGGMELIEFGPKVCAITINGMSNARSYVKVWPDRDNWKTMNVHLANDLVSHVHAMLVWCDPTSNPPGAGPKPSKPAWHLMDLASTNKTWVQIDTGKVTQMLLTLEPHQLHKLNVGHHVVAFGPVRVEIIIS